jgi:hypothetical protein
VDRVPEVVPGYPNRLIPKPEHAAELKQRTLTNLYNQRPAWLVNPPAPWMKRSPPATAGRRT